ncbi:MAG TPA: thymidylate synthase [Sedimentisphaerales bacterium]|nr:thymidylate synthase [Sedimentisphaerales bacterium]
MDAAAAAANIPVISVAADCLPEAWEKAMLAVWDTGLEVKTQYDKPEDPPSRDATVVVTISNPLAEPRIHKNFPGGPAELEAYRQEVINGIHDHWIDPAAGKWTYTYHQRLFAYCPVVDASQADSSPRRTVDQIRHIIDCLSETGHTRRAQAITWIPAADMGTEHPPCLQRIWCRLVTNDTGAIALNMNTHWRSRDLYKAWFMNVYAFTDLQRMIAEEISGTIGRPVALGRYVDISDSLHIYGSYFDEVAREVEKMRQSPFTSRAWESTHPAFEMMTQEAREKLAQDPDWYAKARG